MTRIATLANGLLTPEPNQCRICPPQLYTLRCLGRIGGKKLRFFVLLEENTELRSHERVKYIGR
jgi:hypothetical protein